MIKVEFDFAEVQKFATSLGAAADQIPFATAVALNRAADVTRNFLIKQTWPQHIQQRNSSFIAASLTTRGARADKRSAAVEIYDKLDRGNLQMQALGGVRSPRGGSSLAVPSSKITKTSRGVPQRLRPKSLVNAIRIKDALYTRDKRGRLKLMYVLKSRTPVPKRVPFYEDFATSMRRELIVALPIAIAKATATRRR
jgi:hypothetical protein